MSEPKILSLSAPVDLLSLRSQIVELRSVSENSDFSPEDAEKLLGDVKVELEEKVSQLVSECSSDISLLADKDLDELLRKLKEELNVVEGENMDLECEIAELSGRCIEDYVKLDSELERVSFSMELTESQCPNNDREDVRADFSYYAVDPKILSNTHDYNFEMLELSQRNEKNTETLNSMQDLESMMQRFDVVQKIEEALSGFKVVEFEGNCIRLSLKTHIPNLESVPFRQEIEGVMEPLELNHELMMETVDGTMELKTAEIFPNDIYIGEITNATKSLRSSFEWFVRKVQDKIVLSSLIRFAVKNANKSRHSFEYLDKEDAVVAHMVGGVDAFIKLSQGWPLLNSPLELISLKSTSKHSKELSLSFIGRIMEAANSLNVAVRLKISSFTDAIEEISTQMSAELHADNILDK